MYATRNYKSKKMLKDAIIADVHVGVYQPGPFGGNEPKNGWVTIEGPWYPEPHRWYAQVELKDGRIIKVK